MNKNLAWPNVLVLIFVSLVFSMCSTTTDTAPINLEPPKKPEIEIELINYDTLFFNNYGFGLVPESKIVRNPTTFDMSIIIQTHEKYESVLEAKNSGLLAKYWIYLDQLSEGLKKRILQYSEDYDVEFIFEEKAFFEMLRNTHPYRDVSEDYYRDWFDITDQLKIYLDNKAYLQSWEEEKAKEEEEIRQRSKKEDTSEAKPDTITATNPL